MKSLKLLSLLSASALLTSASFAQIASDVASNYDTASWNGGASLGSGFKGWDLSNNNNNGTDTFAGYFIGDSTAGTGDINTSGVSFGMYANPGLAFATAVRGFDTPLTTGQTFSIDLGVNFRNGSKGINIRDTGGTGLFNFDVSGDDYFVNGTTLGLAYSAISTFTLSFEQKAGTTVGVSITRGGGTVYSQDLDFGAAMDNFELYVSGTENGDAENNLYANNLLVVPEPSAYAAILGLAALGLVVARRR